jgi:hypothetical protein
MPNTLIKHTGELPFERYNAVPYTQEGQYLHVDMIRRGATSTLGKRSSNSRPCARRKSGPRPIPSHDLAAPMIAINN